MFFMLSVPSPAARTSWRNMYAIASAPSAIRKTMMTRTRLPPESCTTSGLIPVMDFLLGIRSRNGADCAMRPGDHVIARGLESHRVRPADDDVHRRTTAYDDSRAGRQLDVSAASAVSWMTNT